MKAMFFVAILSATVSTVNAQTETSSGMSPAWRNAVKQDAKAPKFPTNPFGLPMLPFSLTRQDGTAFDPNKMTGRPVLLNFAFTECSTVCTPITLNLAKIRREALKAKLDLEIITVTVNPVADSPARLKKYASNLDADHTNWHWLSGSSELIDQTIQHYGALAKSAKPDDHRSSIYLINRWGQVFNEVPGNNFDHARLMREIKAMNRL